MARTEEEKYIRMRLRKAAWQSIPFYLCRVFLIKNRKIVFTTIEGTTGYTCNPKYIAEEFIKYNKDNPDNTYELVWLVNDTSKKFPKEIKVVKNTLWNRAYQLTTARFWIDNSRKQLECRKRKGQIYIQTWHAKLGFKPTCLDRGASFSKIAYLVSKHDSDMVDYWLSNSDWYDKTLKTGSLYEGKALRTGSPRCDILVKAKNDKAFKDSIKKSICEQYGVSYIESQYTNENTNQESDAFDEGKQTIDDIHFLMYAPTFRGGSQGTNRTLENEDHAPDYVMLKEALEKKFGGTWYILLRLHPQLVARNMDKNSNNSSIIDVSRVDDMYEILAGCEAFITDYSSAAFDAMVMEIPIFLYCDDYDEYVEERGKLLWELKDESFPFVFVSNNDELKMEIESFGSGKYIESIKNTYDSTGMVEGGNGSSLVLEKVFELITNND